MMGGWAQGQVLRKRPQRCWWCPQGCQQVQVQVLCSCCYLLGPIFTPFPHTCVLTSSTLSPPRRWYSDRHEVRSWQEQTKLRARKDASTYNVAPFVSTLLGRTRPLPDLVAGDRRK